MYVQLKYINILAVTYDIALMMAKVGKIIFSEHFLLQFCVFKSPMLFNMFYCTVEDTKVISKLLDKTEIK